MQALQFTVRSVFSCA